MKNYFLILLTFLLMTPAFAANRVLVTITVTNNPINGDYFTLNGDNRTWKTSATNAASWIQIAADIGASTTNMFNQFASHPFAGSVDLLTMTATNVVQLRGQTSGSMVSSLSGTWGYITITTNAVAPGTTVIVPVENYPNPVVITNVGNGLVSAISTYATTKFITATPALANYVDTTSAQSLSNKTEIDGVFQSGLLTDSDVGYLRLPYNITTENGLEFYSSSAARVGTVRGDGSGIPSFYATSVYPVPTNGFGAYTPTADNFLTRDAADTRYGVLTANNSFSGHNTFAQITNSAIVNSTISGTVIGGSSTFSGTLGTVTGGSLTGPSISDANLEGTIITLQGGYLENVDSENMLATNLTAKTTLTVAGDVSYTRYNHTTLASGVNIAVNFGTNVFVEITAGPAAAFTIYGIANGRDGKFYYVRNNSGYQMTVGYNAGDPNTDNRIMTASGTDTVIGGNYWVQFIYNARESKWDLINSPIYAADLPSGINATNISSGLVLNADFDALQGMATNGLPAAGVHAPTASIGLAVVNGSATTAMRSDAAPPLDQSIAPTWTGTHSFIKTTTPQIRLGYDGTKLSSLYTDTSGDLNITPFSGLLNIVGNASISGLTASQVVFTDTNKKLVSKTAIQGFDLLSPMTTLGDIIVGGTSGSGTRLADIATGNSLITGGVGAAPSYGKIGLTTHVSGTLPVANGGSGATTLASNGILYGNGTSAIQALAVNASATQMYLSQTSSGTPAWSSFGSGTAGVNTRWSAGGATLEDGYFIDGSGFHVPRTNDQITLASTTNRLKAVHWINGSYSGILTSTVASGTAPFTIASTTENPNLNANLWQGKTLDYLNVGFILGDMMYWNGSGNPARLLPNQSTNIAFLSMSGTGGSYPNIGAAPVWSKLEAGSGIALNQTTLTNITISASNVPLASGVSGTLPVPNGGTGVSTITSGNIPQGQGTSPITASPINITSTTNATVTGNILGNGAVFTNGITDISKTLGSVPFYGTGGLMSQDNAHLFFDDTNDYLGVGTATPVSHLHVSSSSASDPRGIMSAQYSTDAVGARIHMRKGRGTESSPTIVVTGDILGRLRFSGYDGANYIQTASVDVGALGTMASTRVPSYLAFSVGTDAASTVLTERMRILPAGNVLIGTTTSNGGLHEVLSTTEQLRLSYDATHYSSQTVNSSGNLTIAPSGGQTIFTGGINLSQTTASTEGVIYKGSNRFIHNFFGSGSDGANTFLGEFSGNFTMGTGGGATGLGSYNVGLGYLALSSLTTGFQNVGIGYRSLTTTTTGGRNMAIGLNTLSANTTGSNNVAIGGSSMQVNVSGSFNVAIGQISGGDSTGDANTFIGWNTGRGITTGSNNTILGANVTGLSAALASNIILANGGGTIKAQHDGSNWTLTGNVTATGTMTATAYLESGASFGITSDATVANTTSETTLLGTAGLGSKTLSANVLTVGRTLHGVLRGRYGTAAVPGTVRIKVKFGSTVILDTNVQTPPSAASGKLFDVDYDITCRTTGGSGTIWAQGKVLIGDATGLIPLVLPMVNTATSTIDTTATQVVDVTATWATADVSNTITGSVGSLQ